VKELPVAVLAELLASGAPLQCIDVREPWEHETASLPGFKLLPLSRIQSWCDRLNASNACRL
jgi:rhodanese-related sulfurtransferase